MRFADPYFVTVQGPPLPVQEAVEELKQIKPRHEEMDALLSETASKLESLAAERSRLQASFLSNTLQP